MVDGNLDPPARVIVKMTAMIHLPTQANWPTPETDSQEVSPPTRPAMKTQTVQRI